MGNIRKFDQSHRTHWRSDDELERIHNNLPWNKRSAVRWSVVALAFTAAALVTQLGIWQFQAANARKAALLTTPVDKVWSGCDEVRAAGLAPLKRGEPGFDSWMDGDNDGLACEARQSLISTIFSNTEENDGLIRRR
jgi:hypothetical protein